MLKNFYLLTLVRRLDSCKQPGRSRSYGDKKHGALDAETRVSRCRVYGHATQVLERTGYFTALRVDIMVAPVNNMLIRMHYAACVIQVKAPYRTPNPLKRIRKSGAFRVRASDLQYRTTVPQSSTACTLYTFAASSTS